MSPFNICRKLVAAMRCARRGARLEIARGAQLRSCALRLSKEGVFTLGENSIFAGRVSMDREGARVSVGSRSFVGKSHLVAARHIAIGSDVLISWDVTIVDHQSHSLNFSDRARDVSDWLAGQKDWSHVEIRPVHIKDKAWLGFGATILPGVTVGEGAVVGACSVVTRDVEPWTVVAGNPAKVIRRLDGKTASRDQ